MPTKSKIQDKTFLFTGTLTELTRGEAESLVEANGGKVLSGVSSKLNYLVVGEDSGSKLTKAKSLKTILILTEKEFLKMLPKVKTKTKDDKTSGEVNAIIEGIDKNEVILNIKLIELEKLFKKYAKKTVTDKILKVSDSILHFSDITSEDLSFFYYSESHGKLLMNYLIEDNYGDDEFRFGLDFFNALSNLAKEDFKIVYLDTILWQLSFCVYSNNKIHFAEDSVSDWENPDYFDDIPYFVQLAKGRGMKKKKDIYGDKVWDTEEVYDLIYDFRDSLASGAEYENVAPNWYLNLETIPN